MRRELVAAFLTAWALAVGISDWRWRRVPNPALVLVVVPAMLALIVDRRGVLGAGIWESLFGFAFGAAILLPGYLSKQVGAGDVKLAAVMGLILGIKNLLPALLAGGLTIGLMAIVAKVRHRNQAQQHRLAGAVALLAGFEWSLWQGVKMGATGQ